MDKSELDRKLIERAMEAMEQAYAPYSNFKVGAALLTEKDEIVTGGNIENISFSPTVCAERVAIFKAVSEGTMNFKKIAIVTEDLTPTAPCGVCRQVMGEFVEDDFELILANTSGHEMRYRYDDIFPLRFVPQRGIGQNNVWQELRKLIQEDNIITDEEFILVQQILDDIDRLEENIETMTIDQSLSDKDMDIIRMLRQKVYSSAVQTANLDDRITEEEKKILKKLAELLDINDDDSDEIEIT